MLTSLNTPAIANAGAALVATSTTALGAAITSHAATATIVLPFAGILVGCAMTYLGRPSTLSATSAGTASATAPAETLPPAPAQPEQKALSNTMSNTTAPTPAVTKETLIGEFADAVLAEIDTVAKPEILTLIQTGETDVVAGLANLLKNLPKPAGIEGALVAPIENAIETAADSYAAAAVAKYGPSVVFALIDAQLHKWATDIGG